MHILAVHHPAGRIPPGDRMAKPRSRALRRGRSSLVGGIYLVTFTTARRRPWFREWDAASAVARALADPAGWADSKLLCWVLMPDHWHGMVQLGECEPLSRNVGRAKAMASRCWKAGDESRLWQAGFHDRALRAEDQMLDVARYIVANPVRAGLVTRLRDYPYRDANWL